MRKLASVLVLSLLLSSFLLAGVAFAQTGTTTPTAGDANADNVTVTVTVTDDAVTLSPDTVTVDQEVNFEFADGGNDMTGFCVVVLGEDDDTPLNDGADAGADAGDDACMTYTFDEAGTYRVAVFEGTDLSTFEFGDDSDFATLTVVEANQDAGATATVTPAATATTGATPAASGALTTTATATNTAAAAGANATPGNLPTTGGEANSWVPAALMVAALALVAGGLLRFAFRDR